jgi:hypothetical protein
MEFPQKGVHVAVVARQDLELDLLGPIEKPPFPVGYAPEACKKDPGQRIKLE